MTVIPSSVSLAGRTVLVTGSNGGIGFEVARQLLHQKASTLILAVRNEAKGNEAAELLRRDPGVAAASKIKVELIDLGSNGSVVNFAKKISSDYERLDVVVLNAGNNATSWALSASGNELVYQVNYLSNALLSYLLLPKLKATAAASGVPSRITFVGSMMHKTTEFNFLGGSPPKGNILEYFNSQSTYKGSQRYPASKLLVTLWAQELAKHVKAQEVIINSVCPGLVQTTGLDRNLGFAMKPVIRIVRSVFGKTVEAGARHIAYASIASDGKGHGAFYSNDNVTTYPFTESEAGKDMGKRLFEQTKEELERIDPAARDVL